MSKPATITIEVKITEHAFDRAKERFRLNQSAFKKLVERAYLQGVRHRDTSGRLKKYLDMLYMKHQTANNIRIYGLIVYLFCNNTLVTVIHLPNDMKKYLSTK